VIDKNRVRIEVFGSVEGRTIRGGTKLEKRFKLKLTTAQASELEPNRGKLVEVRAKKIAVFNVDGKFHAIDNRTLNVSIRQHS
jgi:hypothetical protein